MTEPTKQARQRCADLSSQVVEERGWNTSYNASHFTGKGDCHAIAFARHVQSTRDTASEIVRCVGNIPPGHEALDRIEALTRSLMLPEPVDPLYAAIREALPGSMPDHHAEAITKTSRAALDKAGYAVVKKESE